MPVKKQMIFEEGTDDAEMHKFFDAQSKKKIRELEQKLEKSYRKYEKLEDYCNQQEHYFQGQWHIINEAIQKVERHSKKLEAIGRISDFHEACRDVLQVGKGLKKKIQKRKAGKPRKRQRRYNDY